MNEQQILTCLQSITAIVDLIAIDEGFKQIATDPYSDPNMDSDIGDVQHYLRELMLKIERRLEAGGEQLSCSACSETIFN